MTHENTNWSQSCAAVVIENGKVLLARHTYGAGAGLFIIPGGYVENGEMPQDAVKREYLEETGVTVEPEEIIGIRFNKKDWYVVFKAKYISGKAHSDNDENDSVVWMPVEEALGRDDVPDLTKQLIICHQSPSKGFSEISFNSYREKGEAYLYGKK